MEEYGLTPSEYYVTKLIFMIQEGYEDLYLRQYLRIRDNKDTFRDTLVSLQNKGIILKSWDIPEKGAKFDPREIPFNKNFFRTFFKSSLELGKELWDAYPMFVNINGYTYSLHSFTKKFDTMEDFFRYYGKTIHWDLDLHNKILNLIKWDQDNNVGFLKMTICNFVLEKKWNELEMLKDGNLTNINFDTIQQL